MDGPEIITKQGAIQAPDTGIGLQQWLFERVKDFIAGRVLEIAEGEGIIAPVCKQNGIHVDVMGIDLADEEFEERYVELLGMYDTLIVLHAGEQIKNDRNIVTNTTQLLKQGGHLITRLPAYTALFNGLDQGFRGWKRFNLEYINKVLRKDYSIMKTRYFMIVNDLQPQPWINKYSERVKLFNTDNSTGFNATGLSIIVAGKKR
jgi:hypothetical protein